MGRGHGYDEGKYVIDEGVESPVGEGTPRQRSHRFKSVVDEKLGQHKQEPEGVDPIYQTVDRPRVPAGNDAKIKNGVNTKAAAINQFMNRKSFTHFQIWRMRWRIDLWGNCCGFFR